MNEQSHLDQGQTDQVRPLESGVCPKQGQTGKGGEFGCGGMSADQRLGIASTNQNG